MSCLPTVRQDFRAKLWSEVLEDWAYWRPIAYGLVKLSGTEFDAASPAFVYKMNLALEIRAEEERKALREAEHGGSGYTGIRD